MCINKYQALHITANKRKNPQLGFFPNFSPSSTPQNFVYSDMLYEMLWMQTLIIKHLYKKKDPID